MMNVVSFYLHDSSIEMILLQRHTRMQHTSIMFYYSMFIRFCVDYFSGHYNINRREKRELNMKNFHFRLYLNKIWYSVLRTYFVSELTKKCVPLQQITTASNAINLDIAAK